MSGNWQLITDCEGIAYELEVDWDGLVTVPNPRPWWDEDLFDAWHGDDEQGYYE